MRKIIVAVVLGLLILVGLGIYWKLGGFNAIQVSLEDSANLKLLGLTYRGTPQDPGMLATFQQLESVIEEFPQTHLHTIYYNEPAGKLDTLEVFVGLEYIDAIAEKETFEIKEIRTSMIIVAAMQSHRLVMPSPRAVKAKIAAFAEEKGLILQDIYIDRILDQERVEVLAPVVKK